jgi:superfamily II DNA or RNA helicase
MEVGIIGDGVFEPSRITVGIINSLYNHRLGNDYLHGLGITLVDECHRVSKLDGIYSKTLQQIPATIRIGLTATLPADTEAVYALEGNLGPVIYSVDRQGLTDTGRLAIPKIRILQIPIDADVANLKKYSDVYSEGVVNSHKRNGIIIDEIAKYVLEGRTCLVIVRLLEHGQNLFDMIKMRYPKIRAYYAHGTTESEERERIRQELQARNIDVAITSTIWKEGVDIPSLNVVVNAAGSKSELFCLQVVGRGMRAAPGKDEFIILDFFDPSHHFLVSHFGYRIAMYFAQNWIKT